MAYPTGTPSYAGFISGHTLEADSHAAQHNQEQADIIALAGKLGLGASTPTAGTVLRGTSAGNTSWTQVILDTDVTGQLAAANAINVLKAVYPINCIYTETSGVNPNTTFGFGTWTAFGAGRVLIGNGTSDQVFTAGATGGESNHTLTSNEMPSHTHTQDAHSHVENMSTGSNNGVSTLPQTINQSTASTASTYSTATTVATNQNTGGGASHNTLQPYIVVYFWQRTA